MRDWAIRIADLNQLRVWTESKPEGDWYKDFGSFKICGHGSYSNTLLLRGQAKGELLWGNDSGIVALKLPTNPVLGVFSWEFLQSSTLGIG
jgi:hypothetical protein